jgi:type IV pilus assembly protein PilW
MKIKGNQGFTLTELVIALAVGGIVTAAVFSTYRAQQDTYVAQEEIAIMQQNLRAAVFYIEREIRLAGCNPTEIAASGFFEASSDRLRFAMDISGGESDGYDNDRDGQVDEADEVRFCDGHVDADITYSLQDSVFLRSGVPIAANIDALNFVYFNSNISDGLDNDGDWITDELDEGRIGAPGDNTPLTASQLQSIRAIQVSLLVRSDRVDPKVLNADVYRNQMGDAIFGEDADGDGRRDGAEHPPDHLRRRMLTSTIKVRNSFAVN